MIAYKMHLIRTGSTFDGSARRYVGQADLPLSLSGAEELEAMREGFRYPGVEMVFTSPLRRCVETAEILYPDLLAETLPGLMDMRLGAFEGRTYEELRDGEAFEAWMRDSSRNTPPGGEDALSFQKRTIGAVRDIFRRMMGERMQNVAVVTHGGVIMSLLTGICLPKRPLHEWAVGNGAGYTLLFTSQMWMRDGCAEVFRPLPEAAGEGEDDFFDCGDI